MVLRWQGAGRALTGLCLLLSLNAPVAAVPEFPSDPISKIDQSVIPLRVPTSRIVEGYRRHHQEDCSATVVRLEPLTLLSAWHCFDGFDDLSRSPQFRVAGKWFPARLIASGGSMEADWALLTVLPPIHGSLGGLHPLPVLSVGLPAPKETVRIAGYPKTSATGVWTSSNCPITGQIKQWIGARCMATQGVSGGPALIERDGRWFVAGVVSAQRSDRTLLIAPLPAATVHLLDAPNGQNNSDGSP